MIKVCLVISTLGHGGTERQVVNLANHLDGRRFEAHVCSLSRHVPLAADLDASKVSLHIVERRSKLDFTVIPRLARLLKELRIDVVQGFLTDAQIAVRLAGRAAGTPLVFGSERNSGYRLKLRHRLIYRITRGRLDYIIANSQSGADFNARLLGYGAERYFVVPNGIDLERFSAVTDADAAAVRVELGIGDGERLVGIFAGFRPQKNHFLFFRAAGIVAARVPGARFLVVGDVPDEKNDRFMSYKQEVMAEVARLGLQQRCIFTGQRRDVPALYRACDLTVLSSSYEGTPNVLLESMACGVPVVTTDTGDSRAIVENGRCGYVVPRNAAPEKLAERICLLLQDDLLRREMGDSCRSRVRREYSLQRLAMRTGEVFLEALARKAERGIRKREPRKAAGKGAA